MSAGGPPIRRRAAPLALLSLLASSATATPAGGASNLVDLLDFDQGTVLVAGPASYREGVAAWAPFGFADGDPALGWCSAEGRPTGGDFVYELETDSEPRILRVRNTGVEEQAYPGVSLKGLELWTAGATGPFRRVATFQAARNADREFPVPAGKPVRRIKLVVASNHGHAAFTETMEVDLLGKKVGPIPSIDVNGVYYSESYNGLRMRQTGKHIDGCYDYWNGVFFAELEGRVARGTWREFADDKEFRRGPVTFVVGPAKAWVKGVWFEDTRLGGSWDLRPPADPAEIAKCTPPAETLTDRLKTEGRLSLYGIHFDVDVAVPRADSEPALRQLLETLQADPGLNLSVEGHTDSKNTDAYNQDLSERRARAVVAWLAARGVDPARLTAAGFGRQRPVASNATAQGRALNRRVEVALPGR